MNETTGTDRDKPTRDDIGRVYLHGTTVRVMLVNDREVSQNPDDFEVIVKCMDPTPDGNYLTVPVDCRNLTVTDERAREHSKSVSLVLTPSQAALLHSLVRESGWGYTESGAVQVSAEILELADAIRGCREASGTADVKPNHANQLFDTQFEGVNDRKVITGEDESTEETKPATEFSGGDIVAGGVW